MEEIKYIYIEDINECFICYEIFNESFKCTRCTFLCCPKCFSNLFFLIKIIVQYVDINIYIYSIIFKLKYRPYKSDMPGKIQYYHRKQ